MEDKLKRAQQAANYEKRFGYSGVSARDDSVEGSSGLGLGEPVTAFDKMMAKDNRMLDRMQAQAQKYLQRSGSSTNAESLTKMSKMSSRLSDVSS